jgi:hypothetical protein
MIDGEKMYWMKRAHHAVKAAIAEGRLVRPARCETCAEATYAVAHHDDYDKPLDVRWLCRPCHSRHHAALRPARPVSVKVKVVLAPDVVAVLDELCAREERDRSQVIRRAVRAYCAAPEDAT